jgi:drug/metabolite transporter (DMT)-like permease
VNYKTDPSKNTLAYLCLTAVCILWGATWVASAYSVRQGIPALEVTALRQFIGGILLCIGVWLLNKGQVTYPKWKDLIILAFLNFICSNGLSTWGVQYVPAGLASIIAATYPIWLVMIYAYYYKKEISNKIWIGMIGALIGLVLIFYPKLKIAHYEDGFLFGIGLTFFSTFSWTLGTVYTKNQAAKGIDPYFSIGAQMLISSIWLFIGIKSTNHWIPINQVPINVWYGVLFLVVAGSILAFTCFLYALKNLPAEQVSIYAYINPIVALIISNIFMREEITIFLIIGGAIVLGSVYIINKAIKL